MKTFSEYINEIGEIGYVKEVHYSILYIAGLPKARVLEMVVFESGEIGQIVSLDQKHVEIILFSKSNIRVGTKVARTNELFSTVVGEELLGQTIDPMGFNPWNKRLISTTGHEKRFVDTAPLGIKERKAIDKPLETGVALVDLVTPLAFGQRQLVIGDRKTGKSRFLLQTILSQSQKGTICVYAAIAKWKLEIKKIEQFIVDNKLEKQSLVVATAASDPPGMIIMTPYVAMTIAEYFREQGKDVLLILDDLTMHAQFYRQITLLARRFPGRSSYPGDIFYLHSRLLERAGNYTKGSITCLPVAESIAGDLTGYIQTNIMSMTDGHLFFDSDYFNQGKRPAVNPFLSVTRVGLQAQSPLVRDVSRQLGSFLVRIENLTKLMHFGVEISLEIKTTLSLGERITEFFRQSYEQIIPTQVSVFIIGLLWQGRWKDIPLTQMRDDMQQIITSYTTNEDYKNKINRLITAANSLAELSLGLNQVKRII